MSFRITPLCVRHWDSDESQSATDALRHYDLTDGERTAVFSWVDEVVSYYGANTAVGRRAKRAILCYLRNYGLRKRWFQALAATCMTFYEKHADYSVLHLSLDKMQRMCDFQYTISVLRTIETRVAMMEFQASHSSWDSDDD